MQAGVNKHCSDAFAAIEIELGLALKPKMEQKQFLQAHSLGRVHIGFHPV